MFSKDCTICQIPERRTITPLRYKKFLCCSHRMYGRFRNSKLFRCLPYGALCFYYVICNIYRSLFYGISAHQITPIYLLLFKYMLVRAFLVHIPIKTKSTDYIYDETIKIIFQTINNIYSCFFY